jgi:hypothetical protein
MEERIAQLEKQVEILWDLLEIVTRINRDNDKEWFESEFINSNYKDIESLKDEVNRLENNKEDKNWNR